MSRLVIVFYSFLFVGTSIESKYMVNDTYFNGNEELHYLLNNILRRKINLNCENSKTKLESDNMELICLNKLLSCKEMTSSNFVIKKPINHGLGKEVYAAEWGGKEMAVSMTRRVRMSNKRITNRAIEGHQNLLKLPPNPYSIPVYGYCKKNEDSHLATESCSKFGNLRGFFRTDTYRNMTETERFKLAIQIVASFNFLHVGLGLPRVHCDLHTVNHSLTQFLVADDLRVFIGDMDEIPSVDVKNNIYAKCRLAQKGIMKERDFLAPEERYIKQNLKFVYPAHVTEKVNIWKIPNLTKRVILGRNSEYDEPITSNIWNMLKDIHRQCKEISPTKRPTTEEILTKYLEVFKTFTS